jgi:predicted ATP-grasp superfamily ATP-dependent carboligase
VAARPGPAALVLDVGFVNGLAAVRSLGRAGVAVLAVDHRPSALGLRSRLGLPVLAPDPGNDEAAYVEFLAQLGAELDAAAVVFPTHDEPLNAVSRARAQLGDGFHYPFPGAATVGALGSKREQLERAIGAGVDVPATAHPTSAREAQTAAASIGYPVLVKPADPVGFKQRHRRQAFRCASPAELDEAYGLAEPFAPMIQEFVPGGDEELYTLGSYLDAAGQPLGVFSGRKLLQTPPGIGTCRIGEALWVDAVVDRGLALLAAFAYTGISQVEFKRDPRDGRYKLMEVNARLWQWHGLAGACGVDVPLIAFRDLTGGTVPAGTSQGVRRRWAIALMPRERPVLVRPPGVEAVWARDDLRPAAVHLARVLRNTLR